MVFLRIKISKMENQKQKIFPLTTLLKTNREIIFLFKSQIVKCRVYLINLTKLTHSAFEKIPHEARSPTK